MNNFMLSLAQPAAIAGAGAGAGAAAALGMPVVLQLA
jgi:hypothetical protein